MKKSTQGYIALELKSLERKIDEFRSYLDNTKICSILDDEKRHQEIRIQLLIMKELGPIIGQFDILKKQSAKEDDKVSEATRGDIPLSPLEEGLI